MSPSPASVASAASVGSLAFLSLGPGHLRSCHAASSRSLQLPVSRIFIASQTFVQASCSCTSFSESLAADSCANCSDWNCSDGQLHAERRAAQHSAVTEAEVGLDLLGWHWNRSKGKKGGRGGGKDWTPASGPPTTAAPDMPLDLLWRPLWNPPNTPSIKYDS